MRPVLADAPSGLVVAVSGGPDSVCLMRLLDGLRHCGALPPITVASVDHGLRPGSGHEADVVVAEATALGLAACRLNWTGPKPVQAVQEKAREARYRLLTAFCRSVGASHLLTAHTLDDQAETVLFRMTRGSGVSGLSGMSATTLRDGIVHARPLLPVAKARLVAACADAGWSFVTDPSNQDPRFARTRLRGLLPLLAAEHLDARRLSVLAARAARAEVALAAAAERAGRLARRECEPGRVRFESLAVVCHPAELVLRMLRTAMLEVGGRGPIRLDRLESLADEFTRAVSRGGSFKRTLNGTVLHLRADRLLEIAPEGPRRTSGGATRTRPVHPDACQTAPDHAGVTRSLGNGRTDAYIGR